MPLRSGGRTSGSSADVAIPRAHAIRNTQVCGIELTIDSLDRSMCCNELLLKFKRVGRQGH
jgi:hypothetical protein